MSTRVQKGGQKFRPVAKPRARPGEATSRQNSIVPDTAQETYSSFQSKGFSHNSFRASVTSIHEIIHERHEEPSGSSGVLQHVSQRRVTETHEGLHVIRDEWDHSVGNEGAGVVQPSPVVTWTTPLTQETPPESQDVAHSNTPQGIPAVRSSRSVPVIISRATAQSGQSAAPNCDPAAVYNLSSITKTAPQVVNGEMMALDEVSQPLSEATAVGSQTDAVLGRACPVAQHEASGSGSGTGNQTQESEGPSKLRRKRHKKEEQPKPTSATSYTGPAPVKDAGKRAWGSRRITSAKASDVVGSQAEAETDRGEQSTRATTRKSSRLRSTGVQSDVTSGEDGADARPRRRKRRLSSTVTPSRGRRSRLPSLPPYDPDADPGEELDPTVVTMAAICTDTGQGRVSSKAAIIQRNHTAWKAVNKEKRAIMRAKMEAKKYGRKDDDMDGGEPGDVTEAGIKQATPTPSLPTEALTTQSADATDIDEHRPGESGFNYAETLETNRFNVQVRIGPNGETIIDEESLYVDRAEPSELGAEQYTHVEESEQTKFVNSATYGKKIRGSRWNAEETELFFDALSQFGENYELISYVLPGRDRKACKNKFKAEDKKNPARITFCLNNRVPYDMQTLSRLTGKDFSGPTPEIRAPEMPTLTEPTEATGRETTEPEKITRPARKKSRTPSVAENGVEVLGDVETFDLGDDEE